MKSQPLPPLRHEGASSDPAADQHPPQGRHLLADLHDVEPGLLRDAGRLRSLLVAAAHAARAQVLGAHFHHFGGEAGVTGVVLLSESHITIHTWPERGYAALDVFMCGRADPQDALDCIRAALSPAGISSTTITRGSRRSSLSRPTCLLGK